MEHISSGDFTGADGATQDTNKALLSINLRKGENIPSQNNWNISVKYIKVKQFLDSWINYLRQGSYLTDSVHQSVRKITNKSYECI